MRDVEDPKREARFWADQLEKLDFCGAWYFVWCWPLELIETVVFEVNEALGAGIAENPGGLFRWLMHKYAALEGIGERPRSTARRAASRYVSPGKIQPRD